MAVEADLDKASMEAKDSRKAGQARERTLRRWLNLEPQFRDPMKASAEPKKQGTDNTKAVTSEQDGAVTL